MELMNSRITTGFIAGPIALLSVFFALLRNLALIAPALFLVGCMATPRLSVPEELTSAATIANLPGVRFFGDDTAQNIEQIVSAKVEQSLRERPEK